MKPPNWFLTIVAFCLVVLTILAFTASANSAHDWVMDPDGNVFDRKTATWCVIDSIKARTICADMKTGKRIH